MKLSRADAEPDALEQRAPRFTYPSGSRPLEGYTIKRGVGRGGFGEVYFAVSDAGKEVALKLIRRNLDIELRGVTQCLNLKHPNLIALYDIRSDDQDDRWVVMEFVSGESLEDAVERYPQGMPEDEALRWFRGICAGVAYLHDHGIVHRDLKPANIFVDDGTVKIGDYGLSKFISCSRRSGQTESVGTVHYMAPEISNGRYGREIDTYALGIILYEMLTGHVPFEGESVGEVLMKHLTAVPKLDGLSEPYREIVASALTKDPDRRIKSVSEMLNRLPGEAPASPVGPQSGPIPAAPQAEPQQIFEDDEPILASIRQGWRHVEERFRNSSLHPLMKAIAVVAVVAFMVLSSPLWIRAVFVLGIAYLLYRVLRSLLFIGGPPPSPSRPAGGVRKADQRVADALKPTRMHRRKRRDSVRQRLQAHLAAKSNHERLTELFGSMLLAALVSSMASFFVLLPAGEIASRELYAWTAVLTTVSAWAAMIPVRLMEGRIEDKAPLRFAQVVLGSLVGLLGWALAKSLMLELPLTRDINLDPSETLFSMVYSGGLHGLMSGYKSGQILPPLSVFVVYFAFLFLIAGFGNGASSVRTNRVHLVWILWCGFLGLGLHMFWWFPQPLGALVAAVTALSVQFASPWLTPSRRRALIEAVD